MNSRLYKARLNYILPLKIHYSIEIIESFIENSGLFQS